jgi:hypothetical protein
MVGPIYWRVFDGPQRTGAGVRSRLGELPLSIREWSGCGALHELNLNAARNLRRSMLWIGRVAPESTPAERKALAPVLRPG